MRPRAVYIGPRRGPGRAKLNIAKLQSFAQHAPTMFFPHFVAMLIRDSRTSSANGRYDRR
jgi:hypothetical protein